MRKMILWLTKRQISSIIEETRRKYPIESCGLLFGWITKKKAIVKKIVSTRNLLKSPTQFQISPEEFVNHLSEAEREGLQLIGFYHSHPAAPRPSMIDTKYMKLWPESIWLIISSIDYSMQAYQVANEKFEKVDVKVGSSIDEEAFKKRSFSKSRREERYNHKI